MVFVYVRLDSTLILEHLLVYSALVYVVAVVMQTLASNANRTLDLILLTVSAREDTQM